MQQSEKKGDYWHFQVVGPDGKQFDLLFTDNQIEVARVRAEEHQHLIHGPPPPVPRTWLGRWFAWLRQFP